MGGVESLSVNIEEQYGKRVLGLRDGANGF